MKAILKVKFNFALCLISEDYEAALKHLKRATYVSDLQTEAEDDTMGDRDTCLKKELRGY